MRKSMVLPFFVGCLFRFFPPNNDQTKISNLNTSKKERFEDEGTKQALSKITRRLTQNNKMTWNGKLSKCKRSENIGRCENK